MLSPAKRSRLDGNQNRILPTDRPAHEWYRFVLSFPPHLVRDYLGRFGANRRSVVLDPFCGTGTTLVECKKLGIPSVGIEANPMACLASRVKTDWSPSADDLLGHARAVADSALKRLSEEGLSDDDFFSAPRKRPCRLQALPAEQMKLLLTNSISPLPLHKTLILLEALDQLREPPFEGHERLALAAALVYSIGNLHFGPEVGVGTLKEDAPVVRVWLEGVERIAADLRSLGRLNSVPSRVFQGDARVVDGSMISDGADIVITSPPYPNEKDYTRTTRLESVLLGFLRDRKQLRAMKEGLIRSNTRNVFVSDDDDRLITNNAAIQRIAQAIESRRIDMGKNSGFERLYHKVAKLYFGGMARHLSSLQSVLKPGAQLAYVVGDQASYLRVMIRTGALLAEIAASLGYEVVDIDLFRTRLATATGEQLREEVVVLKWPGKPIQPSEVKASQLGVSTSDSNISARRNGSCRDCVS